MLDLGPRHTSPSSLTGTRGTELTIIILYKYNINTAVCNNNMSMCTYIEARTKRDGDKIKLKVSDRGGGEREKILSLYAQNVRRTHAAYNAHRSSHCCPRIFRNPLRSTYHTICTIVVFSARAYRYNYVYRIRV